MQKIKLFLVIAVVIFGMAFFNGARAEETIQPEQAESVQQAITVATVNMYNAKIVSQENNAIKASFDLFNREQIQPDVRYAVRLVGLDSRLTDEKVYAESITLGENETIQKEIVYQAPAYFNGKFSVEVVARNQNGLTLAMAKAGDITLAGSGQFVEINTMTCYLRVAGEAENKIYFPQQGVDIKDDEKLVAYCDVTNHSDNDMTFTPNFTTTWRSTFGQTVETSLEMQDAITLAKQESKLIQVTLPLAQIPQAYDATLVLQNQQKQDISNKMTFHYVLRGLSATIQNLRLDNDYYQKGDTAVATFFWSASADNFPESRLGATDNGEMQVVITIRNVQDELCASQQKTLDQSSIMAKYELVVDKDCVNPIVSVIIQDDKGMILDQNDFLIESQNIPITKDQSTEQTQSDLIKIALMLVAILIIISLVSIIVKHRRGMSIIVFLIIAGGMLLADGEGVKADSFSVGNNSYVANLNKTTYAAGEDIVVTGSGSWSWCSNTWGAAGLGVNINEEKKVLFVGLVTLNPAETAFSQAEIIALSKGKSIIWGNYDCAKSLFASFLGNYSSVYCYLRAQNSVVIPAPSVGGTYGAVFKACSGMENNCTLGAWSNWAAYGISFEVTAPQTLSATLTPSLSTGNAPLVSNMTTNIGGTATGTTVYSNQNCGGGTISNINDGAFTCTYGAAGTYAPSITVARGAAPDVIAVASVVVSSSAVTPTNCMLPWGGTISNGTSVTAYGSSVVTCGSACASQIRTCNSGVLSGTYTNQACSVSECCPADCTSWSDYSACSEACGGGTKYKVCQSSKCGGYISDIQTCNTNACSDINWREVSPN